MVVDLVTERGFPDLIETRGLIQVHSETVRHDEPVEDHGQTGLSNIADLLGFPEDASSRGYQQLRVIARIKVSRDLADDRAGKVSIQAGYQYGFKHVPSKMT